MSYFSSKEPYGAVKKEMTAREDQEKEYNTPTKKSNFKKLKELVSNLWNC